MFIQMLPQVDQKVFDQWGGSPWLVTAIDQAGYMRPTK